MLNPLTAFNDGTTVTVFHALDQNATRVVLADVLPKERSVGTLPTTTVWCANIHTARKTPVYLWLDLSEQNKKDLNSYAAVQLLGQKIVESIQHNYSHLSLTPKEHITAAEVFSENMLHRMFSDLIPRNGHEPRQTLRRLRGESDLSIAIEENLLLEVFSLGHSDLHHARNRGDYLSVVYGQLFFNSEPSILVLSSSRCDLNKFFTAEQLKAVVTEAFRKMFKSRQVIELLVSQVIIDATQ